MSSKSLLNKLRHSAQRIETERIKRETAMAKSDNASELASLNSKAFKRLSEADQDVAKRYMRNYSTVVSKGRIYLYCNGKPVIDKESGEQVIFNAPEPLSAESTREEQSNYSDSYYQTLRLAKGIAMMDCESKSANMKGFLWNYEELDFQPMSQAELQERREKMWHSTPAFA